MNNLAQDIKIAMVKSGDMKMSELSRRVGIAHPNLYRKFRDNVFSVTDLEKIAEALRCELKIEFIKKESET
jgi:DNA-binding Xre family transcriptional regulator